MAGDFIKIDPQQNGATRANELIAFINSMRNLRMTGAALKATMNHMHDGTDFSTLEALYGIPTGKGQTVFDYVNGSLGSLEGTFQTSDGQLLSERVGQ